MYNQATLAERVAFGRSWAPRSATALVGRILLASIFLVSGIAKLTDPAGTAQYMTAVGIPSSHTLAIIAGIAEVVGGLSIALGFLARIGAIGLSIFLVITTLYFHRFWELGGVEQKTQMVNFVKNLTILGGLVMIVAFGPGRYSLDAKLRTPKDP